MKSASSPTDHARAPGAPSAPDLSRHGRGARPHRFEAFRDIPKSCICQWAFSAAQWAYVRMTPDGSCPWHWKGDSR